ncbi:MAG: hypothetical protein R8K50_01200, partial [Mariprofundus sp.]
MIRLQRFGLILLAWLLCSCALQTALIAPDLKRLYQVSSAGRFQPPVIIIHGVFGSKLRTRSQHRALWPGSMKQLLFSDYDVLRLKIQPDTLEPDLS